MAFVKKATPGPLTQPWVIHGRVPWVKEERDECWSYNATHVQSISLCKCDGDLGHKYVADEASALDGHFIERHWSVIVMRVGG